MKHIFKVLYCSFSSEWVLPGCILRPSNFWFIYWILDDKVYLEKLLQCSNEAITRSNELYAKEQDLLKQMQVLRRVMARQQRTLALTQNQLLDLRRVSHQLEKHQKANEKSISKVRPKLEKRSAFYSYFKILLKN